MRAAAVLILFLFAGNVLWIYRAFEALTLAEAAIEKAHDLQAAHAACVMEAAS